MSVRTYLNTLVGQSRPLPGSVQVPNSAGGYAFAVDSWTRLQRFLILGSEGGSYYASQRALTVENVDAVLDCLAEDGQRTVREITAISRAGRAPRNDVAIVALALALKLGDVETRRDARAAVPAICRTGAHLLALAEAVKGFGGWGRGTQGAFRDWYLSKDPSEVAFQAFKYKNRHGWTHRDILRKVHVRPPSEAYDRTFRWMAQGEVHPTEPALERVRAAQALGRATAREAVALIREHRLPREVVPTQLLDEVAVWEALLDSGMPMTALLRNLAKMTSVGLLKGGSASVQRVARRLTDPEALRAARVHPLAVLVALTTYRSGKGVRGSLTWRPVGAVASALETAFYESFGVLEPSGKRHLLALDVSGSMGWGAIAGLPGITPRVASAAMAMVAARTERGALFKGFSSRFLHLDIRARHGLDEVLTKISGLPFAGTDCALPMLWATEHRVPVDVFVVYTDSETWCGNVHPSRALAQYRQRMGIDARLVVVGMVSNRFSIADPQDPGMLDVVGFDTAAPRLMRDFALGLV